MTTSSAPSAPPPKIEIDDAQPSRLRLAIVHLVMGLIVLTIWLGAHLLSFYLSVGNLALLELKRGRLGIGWEKYESRFKAMNVAEPSSLPRWRGEDLSGRRLLVWPEQGIGEQVLFSGLLPEVIQ